MGFMDVSNLFKGDAFAQRFPHMTRPPPWMIFRSSVLILNIHPQIPNLLITLGIAKVLLTTVADIADFKSYLNAWACHTTQWEIQQHQCMQYNPETLRAQRARLVALAPKTLESKYAECR